jgi:hypothetical protein
MCAIGFLDRFERPTVRVVCRTCARLLAMILAGRAGRIATGYVSSNVSSGWRMGDIERQALCPLSVDRP